jgi:hypothetical protein
MSILNRPGWANRVLINEGRLHSDELKQRITNLFRRTSLGNSPTYVVSKIAEILRREKGDEVDINEITDEDIIRIANDEEVTNGKFEPELKDSIADARQETEDNLSDVDSGLPSEMSEEEGDLNMDEESDPETEEMGDQEANLDLPSEDAEEVDTCGCEQEQHVDTFGGEEIKKKDLEPQKESVKLSPKQVNKLLQENYIKSKQHKTRIEERYRFY